MKQKIIIDNLTFDTTIGIYDWEQAINQPLVVNAQLDCNITNAFFSESIDDTLNYQAICTDIETVCHHEKAKLLETLAYKILQKLFSAYPCDAVCLKLTKPNAIKQTSGVGVHIDITRQEFENLTANE